MKETIAGIFAAFVVVPMLIVSQFSFASRSWVLDRDFYGSIAADERLYEGWENGAALALARAAEDRGLKVDAEAARTAFAAAYSDEELADLVSAFASEGVDRLKGMRVGTDSSLDLLPLKRDVRRRLGAFSKAYAASVRVGLPSSDRDLSVRPAELDDGRFAGLILEDLSTVIEATPDSVPLRGPPVKDRGFPSLRRGMTFGEALDRSLAGMIGFTVLAWFSCSLFVRYRWRDRFLWLGRTLGFAAFFPTAVGAVLLIGASPLAGAGSAVVAERISGLVADLYRLAGGDARRIATALAAALSRIGLSFFVTGLAVAAVAAALSSARYFSAEREDGSEGYAKR